MVRISSRALLEGHIDRIGELHSHDGISVIEFLLRTPILQQIATGLDPSLFLVEDENDLPEQKGCFWANVRVLGSDAQDVHRVLTVGAHVVAEGMLEQKSNAIGEQNLEREKTTFILRADRVSLPLQPIQSVDFINTDGALDRGLTKIIEKHWNWRWKTSRAKI